MAPSHVEPRILAGSTVVTSSEGGNHAGSSVGVPGEVDEAAPAAFDETGSMVRRAVLWSLARPRGRRSPEPLKRQLPPLYPARMAE